MPVLASMLVRVARARRRCSGTRLERDRRAGGRVDQQRARRRRRAGRARPGAAAAGPAPATAAPRRASCRPAPPASRPAASSGRHTWSVPASTALRRKSARRPSSSSTASPSNERDEPGPRRHPVVDRVGREVVVEHDLGAAHPVHRGHRVVGVGDHQEGEVGRAEVRRQPQLHRRVARPRTRSHDATKPSAVIGSSSSGSRTASRRGEAARPRRCWSCRRSDGRVRRSRRPRRRGPPGSLRRGRAGTRPAPRCRRAWPR